MYAYTIELWKDMDYWFVPLHSAGWSYILYGLAAVALFLAGYRWGRYRRGAQSEDQAIQPRPFLNGQFYTNIALEFQTPLTVIQGMLDQMEENPDEWFLQGSTMIRRNSDRLLYLVRNLHDLRKLEAGQMGINYVQGDVIAYLRYLAGGFVTCAEEKNIELHFLAGEASLMMDYDPDKLWAIVSNLLSNAVKFTPEEGHIYFQIEADEKNGQLRLRIQDTGPGFPPAHLPYILDRHPRTSDPGSIFKGGVGIGLIMVRELVDLLGGRFEIRNGERRGAQVSIWLPIFRRAPLPANETAAGFVDRPDLHLKPLSLLPEPGSASVEEEDLPLVLIVEDNPDVIYYLSICLRGNYRMQFAGNGRDGIEKALEINPDIIVSDLMMPFKDGFQFTEALRKDLRTSHIPVLLLTVRDDRHSTVAALACGADAYLRKPFHKEELDMHLHKLIEKQRQLQQKLSSEEYLQLLLQEEKKLLSLDERFLREVRRLVEENLSDQSFGIPNLQEELRVSRSHLHRKIKALTGQSTSNFIRMIRLQKAQEMLLGSELNISEVAYAVGFKNPVYFTQAFTEAFGKSPSAYRKEQLMN